MEEDVEEEQEEEDHDHDSMTMKMIMVMTMTITTNGHDNWTTLSMRMMVMILGSFAVQQAFGRDFVRSSFLLLKTPCRFAKPSRSKPRCAARRRSARPWQQSEFRIPATAQANVANWG